jgi:uncharacterized membrane protein
MPQLDAYALSVVVICIFWLAHRRFMAMILTVDAPLTVITLVMLALVALVPAATRMADFQHGSSPAMTIYGGLVIAIGIACAALWGYAALLANLVSDEAPKAQRWFYFALILLTPPLFLAITGTLQRPPPGAVPMTLVLLFLIGWPTRLWFARRLEPAPSPRPESEPEP